MPPVCPLLSAPCPHTYPAIRFPPCSPHAADGPASVDIPVTMNEMLLRGCMLKNSKAIAGLVIYTGKETRIQMNAAKTPLKVGGCLREPPGCKATQGLVGLPLHVY